MIQRAGAESAVELLGGEPTQVADGVGPQVEDIVPGERLSLLDHHNLSPEQGQFDGCPQPTRPCTQHETLKRRRRELEKKKKTVSMHDIM